MSNRFSFSTADDLIRVLTAANAHLRERNLQLSDLSRRMAGLFQDSQGDPAISDMARALLNCEEISKQIDLITAALGSYREKLYKLYTDELVQEANLAGLIYGAAPRFGTAGRELADQNRHLAFQNEVALRLRDRDIPITARRAYAVLGSKCAIASEKYAGVAHYHPGKKHIKFDLEADLQHPCGPLSSYFHEVGHMIDHQARASGRLSEDVAFFDALRADCQNYMAAVQVRYRCSPSEVCQYIRRELVSGLNTCADVSDIMGSLTDCTCQGLWGHSRNYWRQYPPRIQKEAFANMFSAAMSGGQRAAAVKRVFPTAYRRFEQLLEGLP